ncbi:MAG: NAD(P)/FAD-dependent oxidoreductase [Thermoplasmatota archaeon]
MAEKFLIIGDGIAGATAAEALRSKDRESSIAVITSEGEPLYNRVTIKDYAKGTQEEAKSKIHDVKWYKDRNIDLHLFTPVSRVEDKLNTVVTEDGQTFEYTKLLIATGGTPRKYPAPHSTAENIHTFWTFNDARAIRAAASQAKKGVVIGAGLLGIDLAVIFAMHKVDVKYIMRGNRWWREGLSKEGSAIVEETLAKLGVTCVFHETPTEFKVDDTGRVVACVTDAGKEYPMDVAGVAIGLNLSLRLVAPSNIKTGEGILTDQFLQTSVPNVWAAGDVAQYFDPLLNRVNINGSWASAKAQGKVAAQNMLAKTPEERVPFVHCDFYSIDHFDFPVMSVGNILGDEMQEALLSPGIYRRVIFKDNRLIGAVLIGDAKPMPFMKKIILGKVDCEKIKTEMIRADFDWKGLAAKVAAPPASE